MSDTFISSSNRMPGDELTTNFTVSNPSNMSVSLRAKVEEKWNSSNLYNKLDNGEDVVLKTLGSNWVEYNGYYYYQSTLADHNSVSTTSFTKLTFNPNVEAGVQCTTVDDVRECSSSSTYTNSKYTLTITYEFIDSSIATDNWNYSTIINPNIKAVYTYNEETCQTGNETTCNYSTCLLDNTCVAGTIVDFQVDNNTTNNTNKNDVTSGIMRFHVLTDNTTTLTMQSQRNVVRGVAWNTEKTDNIYGPTTILNYLETATNDWINVNTLNYSIGDNDTTLGYSKCSTINNCNETSYELSKSNTKSRLITLFELTNIGNCSETNGQCAKWLINYLYRNLTYNNIYFYNVRGNGSYLTMNTIGENAAKIVGCNNKIVNININNTDTGARAVVEINKFE